MDEEKARDWLQVLILMEADLNSMKDSILIMKRYIYNSQKNVTEGEIL